LQTMPINFDPAGCQCAEKYDGIQGRWDGRALTTRTGNTINAPAWWTDKLPARPLTGELWLGRGSFDALRSIVCRERPDDRWHAVRLMVFDGAAQSGDLGPYAEAVRQVAVESAEQMEAVYKAVTDRGGEGIVVTDRWGDQFKKKPSQDDDGVLLGFTPGAGKHAGMVGGFILEDRAGRIVKVGAGLTMALRKNPPPTGTVIRFRYNGRTSGGLPRFARFDGIRAEASLNF